VVQAVAGSGAKILTLNKVEPTLEDVFIQLVGRKLDADGSSPAQTGN
jgi:ABC-2 type transport system ATP-binding protein